MQAASLYDDLDSAYPNAAAIIGDYFVFDIEGIHQGVQVPTNVSPSGRPFRIEQYAVELRNLNHGSPTPSVEFTFRADVGGKPGFSLDVFTVSDIVDEFKGARYEVASTTFPIIEPGLNYWLTARALIPQTGAGWFHAVHDGRFRDVAQLQLNGTWSIKHLYTGPALRITGIYVPEPTMPFLVLSGLFSLLIGFRMRRC